ncbi:MULTISPECIES: YraN family protein [unclassified Ruegeria]|uniref:YraN family protein n=1 Tax=unclassified Ruegeria TaxID=2625375 RepID=UPI001AD9E8E3|nr:MULTISPECIES: YraN family protein [unclassified Ruegeria]MBO9411506.1 YraN family protein [Ruegeria sp. R8_1]MBO9415932.1 YraN family protein [Ruegeria sp. R8_2]
MSARSVRSSVSYQAGQSAEMRVATDYERRGFSIDHRRWRGAGGEIDLIARDANGLVFIEVKKSSSFDQAASRINRRQMNRICASAAQFLEHEPDGQLTNVRFDAALVDASGAVQIIENAFGQA